MSYTPLPAEPTAGQDPWYDTFNAWMDGVALALSEIDTGWTAHADDDALHIPAGGTNGQVVTKVAGVPAWANPTGTGGTSDHGTLTGLTDADHPIAAVIGLQAALDAKSGTAHAHAGTYEPLGTAASAVAAHAALADPHSGYLTAAEGAAAFAALANGVPAGGTTGQVLTKDSNTTGDWSWADSSGGGGATAPLVLTSPNATDIALTAKGAVGQSTFISQVLDSNSTLLWAIESDGEMRLGPGIATQNGHLRVGIADPARQGILVKMAASQTAKAVQVTDSTNTEVMHVKPDGTVVGANIGGMFKTVVVLNAAEAVPAGLPTETVILRRPA